MASVFASFKHRLKRDSQSDAQLALAASNCGVSVSARTVRASCAAQAKGGTVIGSVDGPINRPGLLAAMAYIPTAQSIAPHTSCFISIFVMVFGYHTDPITAGPLHTKSGFGTGGGQRFWISMAPNPIWIFA